MKKMRKNNKGFTLVELIIVVAIIAILTVAVAPQYLKYVEKSREASDVNAVEEVINVMSVAVADPSCSVVSGTVTVNGTSGTLVVADKTGFDTNVPESIATMVTMPEIQSTKGKALNFEVTIAIDGAGVTVSDDGKAALAAMG